MLFADLEKAWIRVARESPNISSKLNRHEKSQMHIKMLQPHTEGGKQEKQSIRLGKNWWKRRKDFGIKFYSV